jgi:hydrogenase maturation factor
MEQADETCGQFGMQIIGGHTQVTDAVKRPIVSACGIGTAESGSVISGAGAKPDMDIILSKWVGIEGTAIIAKERAAELSMRFTAPFIEKAAELENYISVLPEAQLAAEAGVAAMHDVSEGGIYGALWEMADGSGVGLFVDLKKIPIRQETIEISEFFGINPYMLLSGGAMLMAAYDGEALTKKLEEAGIPAAVIGRFTDGKDRIIMKGDERSFLERPQPDEIYGKY